MPFPMKSYSLRFSSLFSGSEIKIYPDPEVTQKADKAFDLTVSRNDMKKSVSKNPNVTNYPKKKNPTKSYSLRFFPLFSGSEIKIYPDLEVTQKADIAYHEKTSKLAKSNLKIRKRRKYTSEFKKKFVNYIVNDGLTKRMAAKKFNIPYSTATQWIQLALQNNSGFIKNPKKISEPSTTSCKHILN